MTKIGKLWTGSVAYVSLLVGAGLSVAGNLADTYRTRGADVDTLDKVMAAGWPILVLLAIEMFVSRRWSPKPLFQVWRWLGCLAVGGMAMVVSWTHLHDLMSSRGQLYIVAILGPLAIDGMAIMATGLILSTRVQAMSEDTTETVKTPSSVQLDTVGMWTGPTASVEDVRESEAAFAGQAYFVDPQFSDTLDMSEVSATRPGGDLDAWSQGYERALDTLVTGAGDQVEAEFRAAMSGPVLDTSDEPYGLVRPAPLPRRTSVPPEVVSYFRAWDMSDDTVSRPDMLRLVAADQGVSYRTVARWASSILGPVSGAGQ
jgi:hypothetical protein